MQRLILFVLMAAAFVYFWKAFDEIPLRVMGQPTSTGLLQRDKEAPFFAGLRAATQIPFHVVYQPGDSLAIKDTFQLQMLRSGELDLVSLRFMQNAELEPSLAGIDLVGMIPDYRVAKQVIAAYSGTIDRNLQEKFKAKLLGIWSFGPQEFFCSKPIQRLVDIKGLKVRVGGPAVSPFILALGGVPAVIPFGDTKNALAIGLADCAITSAASANTAGWLEHAQYSFPVVVQFGFNGYAISLSKWNALSLKDQVTLERTFAAYTSELWQFTEETQLDAARCNTGGECKRGNRYQGKAVPISAEDVLLTRDIMMRAVIPAWAEKCEKISPGCVREWQDKLSVVFAQ